MNAADLLPGGRGRFAKGITLRLQQLKQPLILGQWKAMAFGQRQFAAIFGVLGTAYMMGLAFGSVLWSEGGRISADPEQPWQLYRWAMRWCWALSVLVVAGYALSISGGRRLQDRLHP